MFKENFFFILLLLLICSCKNKKTDLAKQQSFVISLSTEGANNRQAYLYKFNSSTSKIIDSVTIIDNNAVFKGQVETPERFIITISKAFGGKLLIIENDSIQIEISKDNLVNASIYGSELNDELNSFQKKIEKIYSKVDVLFPEMQRARLENDAEKLAVISIKIQNIEVESIEYSFEYATSNLNSYISAMILNDLSKRDSIDIKRIEAIFNKFSSKVKNSIDAKELNDFLQNNHK